MIPEIVLRCLTEHTAAPNIDPIEFSLKLICFLNWPR
jgi:hypothetical protein